MIEEFSILRKEEETNLRAEENNFPGLDGDVVTACSLYKKAKETGSKEMKDLSSVQGENHSQESSHQSR